MRICCDFFARPTVCFILSYPWLSKPIRVCRKNARENPGCDEDRFLYICLMKALVITPKNEDEFKFLADLLKKLGINSSTLTPDELEDIGLSKLLRGIDKTKKASRAEVMKKLSA